MVVFRRFWLTRGLFFSRFGKLEVSFTFSSILDGSSRPDDPIYTFSSASKSTDRRRIDSRSSVSGSVTALRLVGDEYDDGACPRRCSGNDTENAATDMETAQVVAATPKAHRRGEPSARFFVFRMMEASLLLVDGS